MLANGQLLVSHKINTGTKVLAVAWWSEYVWNCQPLSEPHLGGYKLIQPSLIMKQVLVSWHHLLICSSTGMENCDPSAHDCSSLGIAIFSCMFTESPKKRQVSRFSTEWDMNILATSGPPPLPVFAKTHVLGAGFPAWICTRQLSA